MAEVGLLQGLAVVNPIDQRIQDYRQHDLVMRQNEAIATAKTKAFADSVEYNNAVNEFDNKRIRELNDPKIREIGKFYKENPDALYNPDKLMYLNQMRRSLKDNPEVLRGMASDDSFKRLNADLAEVAKNPSMYNQKAYDNYLQQKDNYLKYGNQLGIEASQKEGFKPFVYQKPAEFIDLSKKGQELGNKFQDVKVQSLKNGRAGAWETVANDRALERDAQAFYLEHKEQFDQQHGTNGLKVAKELIKSGVPYKFDWGDNRFAEQVALLRMQTDAEIKKMRAKGAGKDASGFDYYKETIQNKKVGADSAERLDATFGSKPKHYIKNDNGSVQIDNTGDTFNYNGDFQDIGNGIKRLSGYVYKPIEWGVEQGVVEDAAWLGTEYKVLGEWAQTAKLIDSPPDKEGKVKKLIKIKTYTDVDGNSPAYQGKYNSLVATSETRTSAIPSTTQVQIFEDDAGNAFDAQGKYLGKASDFK